MTSKNLITAIFVLVLVAIGVMSFISPGTDSRVREEATSSRENESQQIAEWTCPMHPSVREPEPGVCPICEMKLVPARSGSQFTASEVSKAKIRTALVERKFVTRKLSLYGKVEVDQTRATSITAWVSGRIEKLHRDHHGMQIRKGEKMIELYSPELRATHRELIRAHQRLTSATTQSATDRIERDLSSIRARLREWGIPRSKIEELAQQETPSDSITLTAPQQGVIQTIHKREGEWVKRGEPLYSLANLDRVWITLFPYESEVASLRIGQKAHVDVHAFPGRSFDGRIGFINEFVHDPSRTIHAHVHIKNPSGMLKPGMYADARVDMRLSAEGKPVKPADLDTYFCKHHPQAEIRMVQEGNSEKEVCAIDGMELTHFSKFGYVSEEEAKPPLVIPNTAPLLTGKRAVVYVLDQEASGTNENTGKMRYNYELREVTLGPETEQYYIVKDGLKEGEQVVYQGAFKIDSELQIRGEPSMMYPEMEGKGSSSSKHKH